MTTDGERFDIRIDDAALEDLRRRLGATRWPLAPRGGPWEHGTDLAYMRGIMAYWRDRYDWRAQERRLNAFEHRRFHIDGRRVHAAIVRSAEGRRPPVLMAHGWPGSFVEFLDVAPRIAHPQRYGGRAEDGATVLMVSLPGCGFSDPPAAPVGPREIARDWLRLMAEGFGVPRFVVHGSDWGAAIGSWLALDAPQAVQGLHITSAILQPDTTPPAPPLDDEERAFVARRAARGPWESGYQIMQGSKPLTLAYGLTDSPAGLAAWLLEKYRSWSAARRDGGPPPMSPDDLLTIVSLYWFAGPGPAGWIYRSLLDGTGLRLPPGARIGVPTAICAFADDVSPESPPGWQQRAYEVVRRTSVPQGGHFPGLDAPEALAADLHGFLRELA